MSANDLAPVLVEFIRRVRQLSAEVANLSERLLTLGFELQWWREYAQCTQDFNHWLMDRVSRREGILTRDVVVDWHRELDRRKKSRKEVAA